MSRFINGNTYRSTVSNKDIDGQSPKFKLLNMYTRSNCLDTKGRVLHSFDTVPCRYFCCWRACITTETTIILKTVWYKQQINFTLHDTRTEITEQTIWLSLIFNFIWNNQNTNGMSLKQSLNNAKIQYSIR